MAPGEDPPDQIGTRAAGCGRIFTPVKLKKVLAKWVWPAHADRHPAM